MENNIIVSGECGEIAYSHEIYGEKFYTFPLSIERQSGNVDTINVMISETDKPTVEKHNFVEVVGEVRTFNRHSEDGNHLDIFVFCKEVSEGSNYDNYFIGTAYICKQPNYRETPLGREVCDCLLAINRAYGKSDYIPSIVWGRNDKRASQFSVGQQVYVKGRLQSRNYNKQIGDEVVEKVAYELSLSSIEEVN